MTKLILISGLTLIAAIAPALAQEMGRDRMAPPSTRAEAEARVKAHFAKLDTNDDGAVTVEERRTAHEKMRTAMQDKHFAMLDANKDGSINRAEFDAGHKAMKDRMSDHRGGAGEKGAMSGRERGGRHPMMMGQADSNNDGKTTLVEMTAGALERFDRVDTNKDGSISDGERKAAHEAMREKRKGV